MTELQNESYGEHTNDFKKAKETQTFKTTLMHHNKLLDNINNSIKDTHSELIELKNSFSFHQVQVNNELISIKQRLSSLEGTSNVSSGTIHVIEQPQKASPMPINVQIEKEVIPNIITATTVQECVEQYCNGWDNILPLKVWRIQKESWTKGKNRVLFAQREYIGKLYLHYVHISLNGAHELYLKYGGMPIGKCRDLCRLELANIQ